MTRDNALYILIGLLAGFISGYFVHEVVVARQAPRAGPNPNVGQPPVPSTTAPPGGAPTGEIERLRRVVQQNPEDAEALLRLANLNYDIGGWERAQELYDRYLEIRPASPNVLTDLGTTYRNMGRFDEALERFRSAREMDPQHWQSLYNQIVVLAFDLGRMDQANELLEELRRLQPGNPDVERLATEVERRAGNQIGTAS